MNTEKKKLLRNLVEHLQNSRSDSIIQAGIHNGFMTDSESAHDATICMMEMLGISEADYWVSEDIHFGILHYTFHFNIEDDAEDLKAAQEKPGVEIRVFLEDNEIHSVYAAGDVEVTVTEHQMLGNEYDDNFDYYDAAHKAFLAATKNDPSFREIKRDWFDWEGWAALHSESVAAHADGEV